MIYFRTARWAKTKGGCFLCVRINSTVAGPTKEKLLEATCRKRGFRTKTKEYVGEGKLNKKEDVVNLR